MTDRVPRARRAGLHNGIEVRKGVSLEIAAKGGGKQQRVRAARALFGGSFGERQKLLELRALSATRRPVGVVEDLEGTESPVRACTASSCGYRFASCRRDRRGQCRG